MSLFSPIPTIVGHRGAPTVAPENTAASFAAAHQAGATWIELDARLSADGIVVVHHDPTLGDGRALIDLTAEEARRAGVSILSEILGALPDGLGVDLEIKNFPGEPDHDEDMVIVEACAELLEGGLGDRPLVLSSFNPMVLMAVAGAGLTYPTALLTFGSSMSVGLEMATDLGCAGLFPHDTTDGLDVEGIAAVHEVGMDVLVWTVDDVVRAAALVEAGADAICTNEPAAMALALADPDD